MNIPRTQQLRTTDSRGSALSLRLDSQGKFALPARDYRVVVCNTGWYNWLQRPQLWFCTPKYAFELD